MSQGRQSPGDATADDAGDQSLIADIVERLDNLWFHERQFAPMEATSLVGRRFGKYTVRGVLGRGAFGVVYRATDDQLQRDVALKVPRPEVLVDAERLGRFQGEAATAAQLDHPGIVPVFEAKLSGPICYIASAVCEGPDLGHWLARRSEPTPARDAAAFIAKLAEAVHYAHSKGILHRDLKPSNILLEPVNLDADGRELAEFQPRLTDFGLAKLMEAGLHDTRSSLLLGTPLYIAPEQLSNDTRRFSPATDVYALGVVLYELLTLRTPFEGASYVEVLDKLRSIDAPPLKQHNPTIPAELATLCAKCLEKDPADRYASAAELGDDLRRYLGGESIRAKPTTWRDRLVRWCRQPQRLKTAGWFTFWLQILLGIWTWAYWVAALGLGELHDLLAKVLVDMLLVTSCFTLPIAWLGWALMRRKSSRLFWLAAGLSVIQFATAVHGATHEGAIFDYLYPTALSKVAAYAMLIIGTSMQLGFYLLAVPAWFRLRRATEHDG
jgi:hypothetical protein